MSRPTTLHIDDPRERALVAAADAALALAALPGRLRRRGDRAPRRILLLRLERIGDLIMTLDAIRDVRERAPQAQIDLAVGSWNAELAALIPEVTRIETVDATWLARGAPAGSLPTLVRRLRRWRSRRYDLGINFEPDIRSNVLLWQAGAARRVGYSTGGGGPLLTRRLRYDPRAHTTDNARRLVAAAFDPLGPLAPPDEVAPPRGTRPACRLLVPFEARRRAADMLGSAGVFVGVHAAGGRDVKQWDPARFAAAAGRLARERHAHVVLTGTAHDRPIVNRLKQAMPADVPIVDVAGTLDLVTLAAILERCDLFITGDTGPMHLAAATGTPVVAVFGPSEPARYAPRGSASRIVRIDLPCAPCNRIRLPPARCRGHIPDCLTGVAADDVYRAAVALLDEAGRREAADG